MEAGENNKQFINVDRSILEQIKNDLEGLIVTVDNEFYCGNNTIEGVLREDKNLTNVPQSYFTLVDILK